jgi:hypothetical protein
MRTTGELLRVLRGHLYWLEDWGLCSIVHHMRDSAHISFDEWELLMDYIHDNRPNRFSSIGAFLASTSLYYWPRGWKYPRRRWLNKHIKLNS